MKDTRSSQAIHRQAAHIFLVIYDENARADSLLQCEMYSQMTLASLAIQPGPGQQWVIQCTPPTSIGKTVG